MPKYEYKVVPAPRRARRTKGVKGREANFARTLQDVIAEEATEGWEYLRADQIGAEERPGPLSRKTEVIYTMLVFRKDVTPVEVAPAPAPAPAPQVVEPAPMAATAAVAVGAAAEGDNPSTVISLSPEPELTAGETPRVGPAKE